ncbi:MAG: ribosomal protein L11 methyltransferase [Candidatus Binatia bacterium]|nr:MAG: ribosomal protein L11 methyltransferase [Candidatus Binatia bacterium]
MGRRWFELGLSVPERFADAVESFLFDLGTTGLEIREAPGSRRLLAYFRRPPDVRLLRSYLRELGVGRHGRLRLRSVDEREWKNRWKSSFPPLEIGATWYVCPPWSRGGGAGRVRIVLDPGLAFGTGQHPTTRQTLVLAERWLPDPCPSALDVGTGSGILAIALAKLGVPRVVAVDVDPQALESARRNAGRNRVLRNLEFHSSLEEIEGRTFPLVLANLERDPLLRLRAPIERLSEPGSRLVAAGLLVEDVETFRKAYGRKWREIESTEEDGWVAFALERRDGT